MISGDTLTIPDVGRIRLAQLEARHDDVRLIMMQVELDLGEMRGEILLRRAIWAGRPFAPYNGRSAPARQTRCGATRNRNSMRTRWTSC